MKAEDIPSEVNIHVEARVHDRLLIDQTSFYVDNQTFQKVLDWLDAPATSEQVEGMNRLRAIIPPWF